MRSTQTFFLHFASSFKFRLKKLLHRVARFLLVKYTKTGKKYQITTKLPNGHKNTQRPKCIPNDHKIYQHLSLQDTPKFTQSWIFGFVNIPSGNPAAAAAKKTCFDLNLILKSSEEAN
jgi:hypothetical protein